MAEHVVLRHDEIPPSSNTNTGVGGRGRPKAVGRTKSRWEGLFQMLLMTGKVPRRLRHVSVTAELTFKDKRRRDADNYYFAISKPLGDALVKGGWLEDDNPEFYAFERVRISTDRLEAHDPRVKGRLTLYITYETR